MGRSEHETAGRKARQRGDAQEGEGLTAAEILGHAHEIVHILVLDGVRNPIDAVGKIADIARNCALLVVFELIGHAGHRRSNAAELAGGHVLLLAGKAARLFGGSAELLLGLALEVAHFFGRALGDGVKFALGGFLDGGKIMLGLLLSCAQVLLGLVGNKARRAATARCLVCWKLTRILGAHRSDSFWF